MHQLAKCQRNGLVRRSVERWHLVHDALSMLPVSDSQQSFQQTKFLVVWGLRGHKKTHSQSVKCFNCSAKVEADNLRMSSSQLLRASSRMQKLKVVAMWDTLSFFSSSLSLSLSLSSLFSEGNTTITSFRAICLASEISLLCSSIMAASSGISWNDTKDKGLHFYFIPGQNVQTCLEYGRLTVKQDCLPSHGGREQNLVKMCF